MRECANSKDFWQINFFIIRILLYNQYSCPSSSIRHKRCMCRIMPEGLGRWRKSRWLVIHHFRDETRNKIRRKRGAGIERHRRQKQARKLVPPALIFLFFSSRLFVRIQEQTRLQLCWSTRRPAIWLPRSRSKKISCEKRIEIVEPARAVFTQNEEVE